MIEDLNEKKLFKGIGATLAHFGLLIIFQIPFIFLMDKSKLGTSIAYLMPYILTMIVFIAIYIKDLKKDFKDFKKNYKKILTTTFKYWLCGFIIMYISGILINLLPIEKVINQQQNAELFYSYPIVEIIIVCLLAPITEEIVFRLSFKKFSNYKWLYATVTGLLFAFIHVITSLIEVKSAIMLIYLIPYGSLGIAFGLAYHKTDNIYGTIFFHALHNAISILELLLIGGIILWVKK